MTNIKIKDIISSPYAISYSKGRLVYDMIQNNFESHKIITLDFSDVVSTMGVFIQSWYIPIIDEYGINYVDKNLKFTNITKTMESQIRIIKSLYNINKRRN